MSTSLRRSSCLLRARRVTPTNPGTGGPAPFRTKGVGSAHALSPTERQRTGGVYRSRDSLRPASSAPPRGSPGRRSPERKKALTVPADVEAVRAHLRDDPADAEVPSHRLLVRAGYIRRAAPGGFTWLPLGWTVYSNVERVIREEMNAAGFQEVHFPAMLPREPYEAKPMDRVRTEPVPPPGPPRGGLPARPHPRGDVHAPREGPVLLVQGPPAVDLPAQTKFRATRPGPAPASSAAVRVRDEGLVQLRHRPGGSAGVLRRAPRRLHPHVRPGSACRT